jgi:hypothetical protein
MYVFSQLVIGGTFMTTVFCRLRWGVSSISDDEVGIRAACVNGALFLKLKIAGTCGLTDVK